MVYVLLDGVGDLPHPDLGGVTPLEKANTPNMDKLTKNGAMGQVISVGSGIAPESDIAVFNMLGYKFKDENYAGRGVIEAIGSGIDFKDGDLALRGNFATLNEDGIIVDRRAGRKVEKEDALQIGKEVETGIKFSESATSATVAPTVDHRVVVRIRSEGNYLSSELSNTDPAYQRVEGMGVAKSLDDKARIEKCIPLKEENSSKLSAQLVNEFNDQSTKIMQKSTVNKKRKSEGKKELSCILLRDAGNKYPKVSPINKLYSMNFSCIVDMPVEIGIARVLEMKSFQAGGLNDYEEKARVAAKAMESQNAIYVHIKGPDEFGHDGDAKGKLENIEDIDKRFFGTLLDNIDTSKTTVVISADHSTPCIKKGHSDDPVPVLVSGDNIKNDNLSRFTEEESKKGSIGLIAGAEVIKTALELIKS